MPKMKTKSSVKRRFKVTGSGKVKSGSAFTSHMMMNKSKSMKRKARGLSVMSVPDMKIVLENFMPYSRKTKKKASPSPEARAAAKAEKAAAQKKGAK